MRLTKWQKRTAVTVAIVLAVVYYGAMRIVVIQYS